MTDNNPKDQLVRSIKEYVSYEQIIKERQNEIKRLKIKQKEISANLMNVMRSNEIDCFDINDGKIIYSQNKSRSPVSKKHLLSCLGDYFTKQGNPEAASAMTKYILDSRETKVKDNIRFKPPK